MDYGKIYYSLCSNGQKRMLDCYTENHHVIPRCMGGSNANNNLTKLTYKEHVFAHKLLTKMFPDHAGLAQAAILMNAVTPEAKQRQVLYMKENNPAKKGAWNSGTKGHGRLLRGPITEAERKMHSERMKKFNPNADGSTNKKITLVKSVDGKEVFEFDSMKESEIFIAQHTGLVVNHASVTTYMKNNKPYKGYYWTFK